jgi:hypothetical protein
MNDHERDEWIAVAKSLGLYHSGFGVSVDLTACPHGATITNGKLAYDTKECQAMLHGLVCLTANGRAWWAAGGSVWYWDINGDMGEAKSQPAALLAMLEAHGGEG